MGKEDDPALIVQSTEMEKSFGVHKVLKGISLNLARGKVAVLIGPSESGKTTFLRCINHFEKPGSGTVQIVAVYADGALVAASDPRSDGEVESSRDLA